MERCAVPSIPHISDRLLAVFLLVGFVLNGCIKVKLIRDVNFRLPPAERRGYYEYMTVFQQQSLQEQHRRYYPRSRLRLLSWLAAIAFLPIFMEAVDRWLSH